MEIWKDIKGYKGIYKVSNHGRVKSIERYVRHSSGGKMLIKSRIMKPTKTKKGYLYLGLNKHGIRMTKTVHRLVAEAFIPNPKNKPQINHKNGIKDDNCVDNLEWCTLLENMRHGYRNGFMVCGCDSPLSKFNENDILDIRNSYNFGCFTMREIASAYDVSSSVISDIINRKKYKDI